MDASVDDFVMFAKAFSGHRVEIDDNNIESIRRILKFTEHLHELKELHTDNGEINILKDEAYYDTTFQQLDSLKLTNVTMKQD